MAAVVTSADYLAIPADVRAGVSGGAVVPTTAVTDLMLTAVHGGRTCEWSDGGNAPTVTLPDSATLSIGWYVFGTSLPGLGATFVKHAGTSDTVNGGATATLSPGWYLVRYLGAGAFHVSTNAY